MIGTEPRGARLEARSSKLEAARVRFSVIALMSVVASCSTRDGSELIDPILLEHQDRVEARESDQAREKISEDIRAKQHWTVRDCIDLACLHNDRLLARGETYYQAVLARDIITAGALPTVTARASYYRQESVPGFGAQQGFSLRARDEEFLRMEVPLFAGFREFNARSSATEIIEAEAAALRHQKGLIAILVVEAFYEVLRGERSLATIERSLATQRARRTDMEARSKAGIARKTEFLLVESQLASTEASRARAANDLVTARARLGSLLGVTTGRPLQDEPYDQAPEPVDTLLERAKEKRSDLVELDRRVKAAEAMVDVAWGEWLPVVQASGNIWQHRDGSSEDVDWDFLLEAELNLFAGGATRARVSDAKSRVRQAEFELNAQRIDVALLVRQEFNAWHSFDETIKSHVKEVAAAEENFRLIQEEYKQRIASNLEVQVAQDLLLNAQLTLEAARLDRKAAWFRIRFATGQLP